MSADNKYLAYELTVIETRLQLMTAKSVEAEIGGDVATQATCDAQIKLMNDAIKVKLGDVVDVSTPTAGSNSERAYTQKCVEAQMDGIKMFEPGMEVSLFLQACDNAFQTRSRQ